ncbi:glycosyltransferase [Photobacterium phosphoreum]|uniref:glycosyltransferase n=1 Tax=Photobacterium phosphoreum TaxID=659 RepID=UPI00242DBD8D|nr:hypothetical protein [Photobacterium phosphoreum]
MIVKKNNLLINATPAKFGGAKTIVENYLENGDFSKYEKVILLAPRTIFFNNEKVHHVKRETSGLLSWTFSVLIVFLYALYYRCGSIISFNNVNCIVPFFNKITYFHTPHIFYSKSMRHRLLRFTIRYLMVREHFVFQSKYVHDEFVRVFGEKYKFSVNWCGCESPFINNISFRKENSSEKYKCIVPIVDSKSIVKNFKFVVDNIDFIDQNNIEIYSLSEGGERSDKIHYIGRKSKVELMSLYCEMDFMLMPSLFETVGLPIFEFAGTGKPVLVLDKPYISGIDNTIGLPDNIFPFCEDEFYDSIINLTQEYEWHKILPLSSDHRMLKPDWSAMNNFI